MQWSDVQPCPLLPVILVIIISTDVRDALWAKQLHQSLRDGGLASSAITYNAQEYRSLCHDLSFLAGGASHVVSRPLLKTRLWWMSAASMRISSALGIQPPSLTNRLAWRSLIRSMALRTLRALAKCGCLVRNCRYSANTCRDLSSKAYLCRPTINSAMANNSSSV